MVSTNGLPGYRPAQFEPTAYEPLSIGPADMEYAKMCEELAAYREQMLQDLMDDLLSVIVGQLADPQPDVIVKAQQ